MAAKKVVESMCHKLPWDVSVLKNCFLEADPVTKMFTRKDMIANRISTIIEQTQTIGKTPGDTMSRTLQGLRDMGFLKFVNKERGVYKLIKNCVDLTNKTEKKQSKGETMIKNILDSMGVRYEREKLHSDLKYKGYLRFDFEIIHNNRRFVVEFDGEQHRRAVDFFGGEKALALTKIRDQIKNNYCEDNNITMIRIDTLDYKKGKKVLKRVIIKDKPLPLKPITTKNL